MPVHRAKSTLLCALSAFVCGAAAAPAGAQEPVDLRRDLRSGGLRPVDQGLEDVGPLSTSLRVIPNDLFVPSGFGDVFAVPGHPDLLMRVSGGLYAVFRRSVYSESGVEIPHDTMFSIGPPLLFTTGLFERQAAADEIDPASDTRISSRVDPFEERAADRPAMNIVLPGDFALPSIHVDRDYREERLVGLMLDAAAVNVNQ